MTYGFLNRRPQVRVLSGAIFRWSGQLGFCMEDRVEPNWLTWGRRLAALAQTGLTFTKDPFDAERYQELRKIAAEIMARGSHIDAATVHKALAVEAGYATPKIDVRAVVFQPDRDALLMVKEKLDGDRWTLPGGWADVGDSPSSAVEREVLEETGYQVKARKILAVLDREAPRHGHPPILHHVWKIFIGCSLEGGATADSIETSGAAFMTQEQIERCSLSTSRVTMPQIHQLFVNRQKPDAPVDFD